MISSFSRCRLFCVLTPLFATNLLLRSTQMAGIVLFVMLGLSAEGNGQTSSSRVSSSAQTSSLDLRYLDTAADPCTDFFQYACGNFSKLYPIPADRASYGVLAMVAEQNQQVLHSLLENATSTTRDSSPNQQKIGDYFASCTDTTTVDRRGVQPLKPELDRIAALKSKAELPGLLAHDQLIGVNAFLSFGEEQDFKDARQQIAVLDQGGLGLPERDYYFRQGSAAETTRQQYVQHVVRMLTLLGETKQQAMADAQKIMQLETSLAEVSLDVTAQRDPNNIYHPMPTADLEKLIPNLDWESFSNGLGLTHISELNVANPTFFKRLNALLASTDLGTIKAYLRWQLIRSTPGYVLPEALDAEDFNFYGHTLRGQPQQRERWKRCVDATDAALGEALGQVYVAREFSSSSKSDTLAMVDNIEAAMDRDIDMVDWMSAETKVKAKEKLHSVTNKIGYPDRWRDYSSLTIVRGDAFGNAVRANEFETRRQLAKIGRPVDRGEWEMSPPTVNAYYDPSMNNINFPAGILQPPLYNRMTSDAENYGHIGAVIGHELTHGFDDQGRLFDKEGNLSNWWTQQDASSFENRSACLVKEYGSFTAVDDVKVNGKLTLGENTADNGGLRLALLAFLVDAEREGLNPTQKRDGFTPTQRFFLSFAQDWCGETRPEQVRLQVQTDPHSPEKVRVNGVIRNMPEFGTAFGCKTGSPMAPEKSCRVW